MVSIVMPLWTWRAWADPIVDFGREMYIPWRMLAGEKLYTDLAYFNGPLSPYVNLAIFKIGGPSIETLFFANYLFHVVFAILAFVLISYLTDRRWAVCCLIVFELLFAQGHYCGTSNYDFIAPYSHELTHGLILALACFVSLKQWLESEKWRWCLLAGGLLGLTFLTKPEIFLALVLGIVLLVVLQGLAARTPIRRIAASAGVLAAGTGLVLLAAFLLLYASLPATVAGRAILGAWPSVFMTRLSQLTFYQSGIGLDAPLHRIAIMVFWFCIEAFALNMAIGTRNENARRRTHLVNIGLVGVAVALVAFFPRAVSGGLFFASLPLWLVLILVVAIRQTLKAERPSQRRRLVLASAFACFALVMLAKIFLNARIYHYGFALALPATLTLLMAWWWLDHTVPTPDHDVRRTYLPLVLVVAAACALHLFLMARILSTKTDWVVCAGRPVVKATHGQAEMVNAAIAEVARRVPENASLAVWPEGALINVLLHRRNSTPYPVLMPPETIMFGEKTILQRIARSPPDYIVIMNKDTTEYGYPAFGHGYAESVAIWIKNHYVLVARSGAAAFQAEPGFSVFRHKTKDTAEVHSPAQGMVTH